MVSLRFEASGAGPRLYLDKQGPSRFAHLFDEALVTTADGAPCDIPDGKVVSGDVEIGDEYGLSPSWISLHLSIALDGPVDGVASGPISLAFESTGVINLDGGLELMRSRAARKIEGSAFITSQHQVTATAYRWLERRQLYGVGKISGRRELNRPWTCGFEFDLYTAV